MNDLSTLRLARTPTERVVAAVWKSLSVTAGAQLALWHDRLARSAEVRAADGMAQGDDWVPKGVASGRGMISRVDMTSEAHHRRLAIPLVAAVLMTAAAHGWAANAIAPQTSVSPTVQAQLTGVFTGQHVNGAPVYRLPPVTVIADRNLEPAKIKHQERLAHTKQAPSKFAARPPA